MASLVAQRVKHLPTMWETWIQSLGREEPREKEMATHSSTLAWTIPWTEKPGRLQSTGLQRVGHDWGTSLTYLQPDLIFIRNIIPITEEVWAGEELQERKRPGTSWMFYSHCLIWYQLSCEIANVSSIFATKETRGSEGYKTATARKW